MGRITVFTADHCWKSASVKGALQRRQVPFAEVNLTRNPERRNDLKLLTAAAGQPTVSVPQVFFNTHHVGGVESAVEALKIWENKYSSLGVAYDKEIASHHDPMDPRLAIPKQASSSIHTKTTKRREVVSMESLVSIPDGTKTTYNDIVERLKNSLVFSDQQTAAGVWYKSCFTGSSAIKIFEIALDLSHTEAQQFLYHLSHVKILHSLGRSSAGVDIYRLQCHMTPEILNSYRLLCHDNSTTTRGEQPHVRVSLTVVQALALVTRLDHLLTSVEMQSLDPVTFKLDCVKAIQHVKFPLLEEAVCDLQRLDLAVFFENNASGNRSVASNISNNMGSHDSTASSRVTRQQQMRDTYMAFALNVYRIMLRYALLKCGIPTTDAERVHLLSTARFDVGGYYFTFQDWLQGILRGNRRYSNVINGKDDQPYWFDKHDGRRKFCMAQSTLPVDCRIHFALAVGPFLGGGNCSLPFATFTGEDLEEQLNIAATVYCNDDSLVQIRGSSGEVALSKSVFGWYRSDFAKSDAGLFLLLAKFLNPAKKMQLEKLAGTCVEQSQQPKIILRPVDWTRNCCNWQKYQKDFITGRVKGFKAFLKRFVPATRTCDEIHRLETLRSLHILDTLPEERFDRITRMVRQEFDVAIVFISLVEENRQWFKSQSWLCPPRSLPSQTDRDISFCGHAIQNPPGDIFYIPNAVHDSRFADNPIVSGGLEVRFYAGYPLSVPEAKENHKTKDMGECLCNGILPRDDKEGEKSTVNIGTLCLVDTEPRTLAHAQLDRLAYYGNMVVQEILRVKSREMADRRVPVNYLEMSEAILET